MSDKHQGWVASLSNGETVLEWTPENDGERSAWGQIMERCKEEGIWVTQIQLQIAGNTWRGVKDADGYCFFRDAAAEGFVGGNLNFKHYAGIGSVIGNEVHCTVIDASLQASQDVRSLASMRAHCVLKPAGLIRRDKARRFLAEQGALLERDLAGIGPLGGLVDGLTEGK